MNNSKLTSKKTIEKKEITDIKSVHSSEMTSLRKKAEEIVVENKITPPPLKSENNHQPIIPAHADSRKVVYELEMHQVELEMQNNELREAKEQLQRSVEKYTELYDFSPSGYFTLSKEGNILDLKLYGSQLIGKERIHSINSRFGFFVEDDSKHEFNRFIESVFSTKDKATCEISLCQNNTKLPLKLYLTGIVAENREQCLIAAIDITRLKQVEEEIKIKNAELLKVNTEKDKLFSIIAHDLRSPFNGFMGLTELLAEGLSGMTLDEIQKIALLMKNSATNLNHLLGNLMEWSHMEQGLIPFVPKSYFLIPCLKESLVLVLEAAKAKNIVIDFNIPDNLVVYADKNMLESVFRNLVFNAIKFTPRGGLITVSAKSLPDNSIEFSVTDNGIGMDDNIIANLFSIDAKPGRKGTENELSTGLGLVICKDLVEKHGGQLFVESNVGKGSVFRFTLPDNR